MSSASILNRWSFFTKIRVQVILFALLLPIVRPAFADSPYLTAGRPDGISLLPAPPAAGSSVALSDLSLVRSVVHDGTAAEKKRATKDSSLAFLIFEPAI